MTSPVKPHMKKILALADVRPLLSVEDIAARVNLGQGRIYALLRQHRPNRPRHPRRRTSELPAQVRGLTAKGIGPARIAALLGVTRQYVYKILAEQTC